MNWNLFLAFIPLGLSLLIYRTSSVLLLSLLLLLWLIFYPNAPYMITDFIHLKARDHIPLVFDTVILLSFTLVGLIAGYISMHLVQDKLAKIFNKWVGWFSVLSILSVSSFGVYIGRILRWNSWEVFTQPQKIIMDMFGTVTNPDLYTRFSLSFVILYTSFSILTYLIFLSLVHTHHEQ